jgi:hypothetical protein
MYTDSNVVQDPGLQESRRLLQTHGHQQTQGLIKILDLKETQELLLCIQTYIQAATVYTTCTVFNLALYSQVLRCVSITIFGLKFFKNQLHLGPLILALEPFRKQLQVRRGIRAVCDCADVLELTLDCESRALQGEAG